MYGCECPEQSIAGDSGFYLCVYVDDYIVPTICHAWNFRERMRSSCLQRSRCLSHAFVCFLLRLSTCRRIIHPDRAVIRPHSYTPPARAERFKVSSFYLAEMAFCEKLHAYTYSVC